MKVLLTLLITSLIIFFSFREESAISQPDLSKGLVAYYSFDYCDARDESGNGSDGILYGHTSCWCGINEEGLLLNGRSDYLEFPGRVNAAFNTTDFTISFYVKSEQYSIFEQSLFSKKENCDSTHMLDIRLDVNRKNIVTEVFESSNKYYPGLTPGFEENGWIHFALVRKGTMAYTYINGELQKEGRRCSGIDISNDAILSFSNSPCISGGKARRFKGVLDELRIYERALTDEEVLTMYSQYPIEHAKVDCFT